MTYGETVAGWVLLTRWQGCRLTRRPASSVAEVEDWANPAKSAETSVVELDVADLDRVASCAKPLLQAGAARVVVVSSSEVRSGELSRAPSANSC